MKILLIVDDATTVGGVERVVFNLSNTFLENNNEICVISLYGYDKKDQKLPFFMEKKIKLYFLERMRYQELQSIKTSNIFLKLLREILRPVIRITNFYIKRSKLSEFKNIISNFKPDFILDNSYPSIFDNYLSLPNVRQPIFTQYCDGRRVSCPGWMTQWGSCNLAERGYSAIEIIRHFYGSEMYINSAEEVAGIPSSWPGYNLDIGSYGQPVRTIQEQLNTIAEVYTAIPSVVVDGIYGEGTQAAVRRFQEIFGLTPDGIVGRNTWYRISQLYVALAGLAEF